MRWACTTPTARSWTGRSSCDTRRRWSTGSAVNGHLRLAALEYLVLRKDWRAHHATGRPRLFGHRFNFTPAGNRFGLPAYFSLHAWVWYRNPAGRFQMFNPRVHCPGGI